MNAVYPCVCAAILTVLSACSSHPKQVVVEPVGQTTSTSSNAAKVGYLVVYSAWSNLGDSVAHHSRYTIRAVTGDFSKEVINHLDTFDEGPIRVPLAPGAYQVTARAARLGTVLVPIVIQERKTTYVHLEGPPQSDKTLVEGTDVVKLPSGEVVGWIATRENGVTH
jgi:Tfp pilus assembly protein PilX